MAFAARAARVAFRTSARFTPTVRTRAMSSTGHAAKKGSDWPWIAGSAVVFIPIIGYLLRPEDKDDHGHGHGHAAEHAHEEPVASEGEPLTDSDGTEASGKEINESITQALATDSPADAQSSEEHREKYSSGAPGQTEESEVEQDQVAGQGASAGKKGTFQKEEDSGPRPTDVSDARKHAK
ncbi:hypothetical protein FIBSPDRAFT_805184, partial [Athelia psychrophila]